MDLLMNDESVKSWPSLSAMSAPLVEAFVKDAGALRLAVSRGSLGEQLIDAGASALGGLEAGRRIAEICLGGLGTATLQGGDPRSPWPFSISVHTSNPVLACLGSQYAGWNLSTEIDGRTYHVLGSGPGRAMAAKEPLFEELGHRDQGAHACLVLEGDQAPPEAVVRKVSEACNLPCESLSFIYAPTMSLAGMVQIVARVLEVAIHKTHELKFPLERIIDGMGLAPLCPPSPDFVTAMGRTNDAIIFGGRVVLYVTGPRDDAKDLAAQMPSSGSRDYGKPFAEIFSAVKGDFYAIDPMLFSPAMVTVVSLESGESFQAGQIDEDALRKSFGHL